MATEQDDAGRLDLSGLRKALGSLQRALEKRKDEFVRDSVIQRFEYTYELSWKLLKRYLETAEGSQSVDPLSRKELYRLAAEKGLVDDVEAWFQYHRVRNETSHADNEPKAEEVYAIAAQFAHSAAQLLSRLEQRSGA